MGKDKKYIYKAQHNIAARLSSYQIFNNKVINGMVGILEKINKKGLIKSFKTIKSHFSDQVVLKNSPAIGIFIPSSIMLDEFCIKYNGKDNENISIKTERNYIFCLSSREFLKQSQIHSLRISQKKIRAII